MQKFEENLPSDCVAQFPLCSDLREFLSIAWESVVLCLKKKIIQDKVGKQPASILDTGLLAESGSGKP